MLVLAFQDGVWIRGLFLEGAGWDKKNSCLIEAEPMQLVSAMPTIHFKPVENKKKSGKGVYRITFKVFVKSLRTLRTSRFHFTANPTLHVGS